MSVPDRYAVIGHPVAHSLSPRIHAMFAQQTGQTLRYEALDVVPSVLEAQVRAFFAAAGRGLNVTVPHKQAAAALADELSERARQAGAVNTLILEPGGRLRGDNTDGVGLVRDLTVNLKLSLGGARLLLLGAGGAARGVLAPLLALAPAQLVLANRDPQRALELLRDGAVGGNVHAAALSELTGVFDLILNATAASLHGQMPELPDPLVGTHTVCYDLAYGPAPTAFMRWARQRGAASTHMGLGMLVEQAAESFYLWRAVRPQTGPVLAALRAGGHAL